MVWFQNDPKDHATLFPLIGETSQGYLQSSLTGHAAALVVMYRVAEMTSDEMLGEVMTGACV